METSKPLHFAKPLIDEKKQFYWVVDGDKYVVMKRYRTVERDDMKFKRLKPGHYKSGCGRFEIVRECYSARGWGSDTE